MASSRTWQAVALLLLLGPVSLAGKLVALDRPASEAAADPGLPDELVAILTAGHLERAGHRKLLNMQTYGVEIYRDAHHPRRCDGVMYIMPMFANAEASMLLKHPGTLPIVDNFFVFQGKVFETFPSFRLWLAPWKKRINELLGQHSRLPTVFGIASTAACMHLRTLRWEGLGHFLPGQNVRARAVM